MHWEVMIIMTHKQHHHHQHKENRSVFHITTFRCLSFVCVSLSLCVMYLLFTVRRQQAVAYTTRRSFRTNWNKMSAVVWRPPELCNPTFSWSSFDASIMFFLLSIKSAFWHCMSAIWHGTKCRAFSLDLSIYAKIVNRISVPCHLVKVSCHCSVVWTCQFYRAVSIKIQIHGRTAAISLLFSQCKEMADWETRRGIPEAQHLSMRSIKSTGLLRWNRIKCNARLSVCRISLPHHRTNGLFPFVLRALWAHMPTTQVPPEILQFM